MAVAKNHNPFAGNDVVFTKVTGYDWRKLNRTGCSLVWGHPQGPTLTRVLIEALEEAVTLGGGYVLVFGCAAGDVGIAALFKVTEGRPAVSKTLREPSRSERRDHRMRQADARGRRPWVGGSTSSGVARCPPMRRRSSRRVFGPAGQRGSLVVSAPAESWARGR